MRNSMQLYESLTFTTFLFYILVSQIVVECCVDVVKIAMVNR